MISSLTCPASSQSKRHGHSGISGYPSEYLAHRHRGYTIIHEGTGSLVSHCALGGHSWSPFTFSAPMRQGHGTAGGIQGIGIL